MTETINLKIQDRPNEIPGGLSGQSSLDGVSANFFDAEQVPLNTGEAEDICLIPLHPDITQPFAADAHAKQCSHIVSVSGTAEI